MCSPARPAARSPASLSILPARGSPCTPSGRWPARSRRASATMPASCGRRGRLGQQRARAGPQREDDQHAEAEGEGERRGAGDHVVGASRRAARPNVLSIDRMSRWKCMVIFGTPVLPDVGQSSATSSAAVCTLLNSPDLAAARAVRSSGPSPPNGDDRQVRQRRSPAPAPTSVGEPVVDQRDARLGLRSTIGASSRARSAAMRGHDDAAGLEHAEPGGDRPRVVRRAQQHPLARHQAEVLGEHLRHLVRPGR